MRSFLRSRFPGLAGKLRVVKDLVMRSAVMLKRSLISMRGQLGHFYRMASRRRERLAFLGEAKPAIAPIQFLQGLRTSFSPRSVWRWHRWNDAKLLVVIVGYTGTESDLERFRGDTRRTLDANIVTISAARFAQVGPWLTQNFPTYDAVFVDGTVELPNVNALVQLKHAAHRYSNSSRIAFVTPLHRDSSGVARSLFADRLLHSWRFITSDSVLDLGQSQVPRFVLGAQGHCAYVKQAAIRSYLTQQRQGTFDQIFNSWVRTAINSGDRVLEFSPAIVTSPQPNLSNFGNLDWYFKREVTASAAEPLPIIFVLPATSMSGGIRAVLEKAEALIELGERVEVWALQGNPTWTEISFDVRKFNTYEDLTDALSLVNAIKVATWWETSEPVFLASLQRGIPVQYVQEFESWFYPNSQAAQTAVVSSYRPEFAYTTTASFQQAELAEIGIDAPIIPPAYDAELFYEDPTIERDENTLLALGRSFFQKNFKQTADAWNSLGESRPNLQLFGFEPEILRDSRAAYSVRPSDKEIADLYRSATAFIQTSLHEGFSLPIIEAMASGCPVITTDSHGNRDFCINEVNCLMVEQGDIAGTAAAIERLMEDRELRERLSTAGIETAKRYSWNRVARETQLKYREFAERSAKR